MIFYGQPGLVVIDRKTHKAMLRFDDKGKYETDNPALIERLKTRFKHDKPKKAVKNNGK